MGEGEDAKKAREEAEKFLKILDEEIRGGNKLFEGKTIRYLDLVGLVVTHWFPVLQEAAGKELVTEDEYPTIWAWGERLSGCPGIKDDLPPPVTGFDGLQAARVAMAGYRSAAERSVVELSAA